MIFQSLMSRDPENQLNSTFYYIQTYNCENENAVDPDIAGIGVMLASVLSTVITIIYILVGWSKNWIRGFPEHSADIHIRNLFRRKSFRQRQGNTPANTKAQEDFEAVILSFSDQQLVTGFAVLISIYIKGDITVYTFRVATAVAWFSSTTHLATLVVLREYLNENKIIRYCRISLMIPNAALLLASQIQSNGLKNFPSWASMHCLYPQRNAFDIISISFVTTWLVFAFSNRIINIVSRKQSPSTRSWLFELIVHYFQLKSEDENEGWPTYLQYLDKSISRYPDPRGHVHNLILCVSFLLFFLLDAMDSLFWEILWLCFSLVYGITGVVVTWSQCSQPTEDLGECWQAVLQMGLGQMIPLVLLILPAFSFLESFSTRNSESRSRTSNDAAAAQTNRGSPDAARSNRLLDQNRAWQESLQQSVKIVNHIQSRWTIRSGQNPYENPTGKLIATVVYIYLLCLFVAAGALVNGGAGTTYAGLLIVLLLVYSTYVLSFSVECLIIVRAFRNRC